MRIAIVGAGVAGPTLAHWLLRGGHEITLIEQAPQLRSGGYLVDFWGVGYTIAEQMGILPKVREAGYQVGELRLLDQQGRVAGSVDVSVFQRSTRGRFTSVARSDLARLIYETVEGRVETRFGDTVTALHDVPSGVRVELASGLTREFDLVVGADGLHSRVRALRFGPEDRFERPIGYHVAAFELQGYRPRDELVYVGCAAPGRQIARLALRDDRTVFFLIWASELAPGPEPTDLAGRREFLRRVFGDVGWEGPAILERLGEVEDLYLDRVSQIRMDRWSDGRVALLGDAAACVSLLAGEGTGLAMCEAYVLAGELQRAEPAEALQAFERRLRPFLAGKQRSARGFASAFAPRTALGVWIRNHATRLLAIPALAEALLGRELRDDLELPDYEGFASLA